MRSTENARLLFPSSASASATALMAYPRRRNHYYQRCRLLLPVISAIGAALLFLFALLSFLAPSPIETDHLVHNRRRFSVLFLLSLSSSAFGKHNWWRRLLPIPDLFRLQFFCRIRLKRMMRLEYLCSVFRLGFFYVVLLAGLMYVIVTKVCSWISYSFLCFYSNLRTGPVEES